MSPSAPNESASEEMKQKFISILLKNGITDEVDDVTITEPPELQGEHMCTATVYVTVTFKDPSKKQKNLFVKKFTENPMHTQMIKQMKVMEKETSFFTEFLPYANQFCKENAGFENFLDFFPKCLYGDDEMLVLDNVVLNENYIMVPKEDRQDFETAMVVLDHLAKFHAATYSIINTVGKAEFKKKWELNIFEGFASENNAWVDMMFDQSIGTSVDILKLQGDSLKGADYTIEKLQSYLPDASPMLQRLYKGEPDDTYVSLNHGDCWNNNMLFKKDPVTGKVTDHIFVDLQITRLGPPTLDLGHYMFTSVKPKVRQERFQELMQQYYTVYKQTVESFKLKCPVTFEELMSSYKRNCSIGFLINLSMVSALGAMKDYDLNDTEELSMEDAMKKFEGMIVAWIERNPEKASAIAEELVDVVKEYEAIKN